jgi:hypothetical protein
MPIYLILYTSNFSDAEDIEVVAIEASDIDSTIRIFLNNLNPQIKSFLLQFVEFIDRSTPKNNKTRFDKLYDAYDDAHIFESMMDDTEIDAFINAHIDDYHYTLMHQVGPYFKIKQLPQIIREFHFIKSAHKY